MKFACIVLAAVLAVSVTACDDNDNGGDEGGDESAEQVGALSESATYAVIDDGGAGLYDYLSSAVTDACTQEQVDEAFDAGGEVTGWKQIDDITLAGNQATATVILLIDGEETPEPWTFVREGKSWRIRSLPGLGEECTG
jgi:hypothetical protein